MGDEYFFTRDLKYYLENGYVLSVIKGISIPFTILSSLIYYIINDISLSLRLANATIVILLIIYLLTRDQLIDKSEYKIFIIHLLILIGTAGGMFFGTNDSFFTASCIIICCEYYLSFKRKKINPIILTLAFSLCILTRPHFIIFFPILFFSALLFLYLKYGMDRIIMKKINLTNFFIGFLIALLFNYPRIINPQYLTNQAGYLPKFLVLSYSDKSGTYKVDDPKFNWTQWHYYSQMVANKNGLGLFAPILPWDEVVKHKLKYGENSLPETYSDYLINYFPSALKRVPYSIFEIFIISIRYVGSLLFLLPLLLISKIKIKNLDASIFISAIIFSAIILWAFIWPRTIDPRWLIPFYAILLIIFANEKNFQPILINKNYMLLNTVLLDFIILWALWKWRIFLYI